MPVAIFAARALSRSFKKQRAAWVGEEFGILSRLERRRREARYHEAARATVQMAFDGKDAIGAQTCDEYDLALGQRRTRHFYLPPSARGTAIGRQLARVLIENALSRAPRLRLRATHAASTASWDALGFARINAEHSTYEMARP